MKWVRMWWRWVPLMSKQIKITMKIWKFRLKSENRTLPGRCQSRSSRTSHRESWQLWKLPRAVSTLISRRGSCTWMNIWIRLSWPRERQKRTVKLVICCKNRLPRRVTLSWNAYRAQLRQRWLEATYSRRQLSRSPGQSYHLLGFASIYSQTITRPSRYPSFSHCSATSRQVPQSRLFLHLA